MPRLARPFWVNDFTVRVWGLAGGAAAFALERRWGPGPMSAFLAPWLGVPFFLYARGRLAWRRADGEARWVRRELALPDAPREGARGLRWPAPGAPALPMRAATEVLSARRAAPLPRPDKKFDDEASVAWGITVLLALVWFVLNILLGILASAIPALSWLHGVGRAGFYLLAAFGAAWRLRVAGLQLKRLNEDS